MFNNSKSKLDVELEQVQKQLIKFSTKGSTLAKKAIFLLTDAINEATKSIQKEIKKINLSNIKAHDLDEILVKQLKGINNDLVKLPIEIEKDINAVSKDTFTITLFGRTMAGKSTLKEILTNGDGSSIGKGGQRTTRDVICYEYKNLKVWDVPGIAAFEGQSDEDIAFNNAKKADLILFLITDDAPQKAEAECLAKIFSMGKPVICLINVKTEIDETDLDFSLNDLRRTINDNTRLEKLKKQFLAYAKNYGQDWNNIRFITTHLKSAFLSRQQNFSKQQKEKLYKYSRFDSFENIIIKEIINKGAFYKFKTFLDTIIVSTTKTFNKLFEYSIQNSEQGTVLSHKHKQFIYAINDFKEKGEKKINSFVESLSKNLQEEISEFCEDNYDKNATENWGKILEEKNIDCKIKQVLEELKDKCKQKLEEILREVQVDLDFSNIDFRNNINLNMPSLVDTQKRVEWGTTIVSGVLSSIGVILAKTAFLQNPLGWAALGVVVIGAFITQLCDNKEDKKKRARQKLENKLNKSIKKSIYKIRKNMKNVFYNSLVKNNMVAMSNIIYDIVGSVFSLSDIQQNLAVKLNDELKEMNKMLLEEALIFLNDTKSMKQIKTVVREPGHAMMLVLKDKTIFSNETKNNLCSLMKEWVGFIFHKENIKSLLLQSLGKNCNRDEIHIQKIRGKEKIAHIPKEKLDYDTKIRIPLAQQLTELLIMK